MLDAFSFPNQHQKIIRPPTLQLTQRTAQSINNNIWDSTSRIIWDTCEICDPGIGWPALPESRITLPPGFNHFRVRAHMAINNTTGNVRAVQLAMGATATDVATNGSAAFFYNTQYVLDQYMFDMQTRWIEYKPGSWLEMIVYQDSGAARSTPGASGTNGPVWISIDFDNIRAPDQFSFPQAYCGSFAMPSLILELNTAFNPGASWALVPFDKVARDDLQVMDLTRLNSGFYVPTGINRMRASMYSCWNSGGSSGNNYGRVDVAGATVAVGMRNFRYEGGVNFMSDWLSVKPGDLVQCYLNNGGTGVSTQTTFGAPSWAMFEFSPE